MIDPASGTNVRYLDRLGRPEVGPDGVVLVVGGERPTALTEARFDKPLPVAVHAEYAVDGAVVPAATVPGTAGEITVTYTLTNTTAEQTTLTYTDAAGQEQQSTQPVFVPVPGDADRDAARGRRPGRGPGRDAGHRRAGPHGGAVEHLAVPADQHAHPDGRPDHAQRPGRGARGHGRAHPGGHRPGPGHRVLRGPAHRGQRGQRPALRGARRAGRGGRPARRGLRPAGDRAGGPRRRGELRGRGLRVAGRGRRRPGRGRRDGRRRLRLPGHGRGPARRRRRRRLGGLRGAGRSPGPGRDRGAGPGRRHRRPGAGRPRARPPTRSPR